MHAAHRTADERDAPAGLRNPFALPDQSASAPNATAFAHNHNSTSLHAVKTSIDEHLGSNFKLRKPSDAALHIETTTEPFPHVHHPPPRSTHTPASNNVPLPRPVFAARHSFEGRRPDSPASTFSSPILAALTDITPLPSPLTINHCPPEQWKKLSNPRRPSLPLNDTASLSPPASFYTPPPRRKKTYPGLGLPPPALDRAEAASHTEDRTLSEYIPEHLQNTRSRVTSVPEQILTAKLDHAATSDQHLHRESYLAVQRRLIETPSLGPDKTLPTPPPSDKEVTENEERIETGCADLDYQIFSIPSGPTKRLRSWRPIQQIGQGAFSKVVLAASERWPDDATGDAKSTVLTAIKIVTHERDAGLDEERMETSIKREIEIMESVNHPSLMRLNAFVEDTSRALLVMNYCPGGDLFDLASQHSDILTAEIIQRIFSELVSATLCLHDQMVVHRDIKLENILLNLTPTALASLPSPVCRYPHPLVTLTDFGLSRHIPAPPESPLLTHRCGSADYAAPEVLLGQPYDGRATDAWALGVTLYALLEGRLPFDPLPPRPGRRRPGGNATVKHRIARCDWMWVEYGDDDGDWAVAQTPKARSLEGARLVIEGLLRKVGRGRFDLKRVASETWVREGICVDGGLRRESDE